MKIVFEKFRKEKNEQSMEEYKREEKESVQYQKKSHRQNIWLHASFGCVRLAIDAAITSSISEGTALTVVKGLP